MADVIDLDVIAVHCRIGSLENKRSPQAGCIVVHCRIGSLETVAYIYVMTASVHCRIGSLEMGRPSCC